VRRGSGLESRGARAAVAIGAAVLVSMGASASAWALNLTGQWSANYHCEGGWCVGQNFPAKDTLTQAAGSNVVTATNGVETSEGILTGNKLVMRGGAGGYKFESTVTIAADGNSWSGVGHDNNGTSGAESATRAGAAAPRLAVSSNVTPVSGQVLVRLPGTNTFVLLSSLRQIPFGSVIDTTRGRVSVTTAAPHGGTQSGQFFEGQFALTQSHSGVVGATLTSGDFSACPTARQRSHLARASSRRASPKHAVRKLWSNAHGSFSTKGNYAAGAVQGTEWLTEDLCEGTLIRVTRDKVRVTDLVRHRTIVVRAGHSYLAKAP